MKKVKAMQLVKALRSGEYEQGRSFLVDKYDRFCCFGVACNISKQPLDWKYDKVRGWEMDGNVFVLPLAIQKEFGFDTEDGRRKDRKDIEINGSSYYSLAGANDEGCTFEQIADYIEANYKDL